VDVQTSAYFFFFAFVFFGAAALAFLAFFAISLLQNHTRHAPHIEICELSLTQILTPLFASLARHADVEEFVIRNRNVARLNALTSRGQNNAHSDRGRRTADRGAIDKAKGAAHDVAATSRTASRRPTSMPNAIAKPTDSRKRDID
jgi:hypothetical protein